MGSKNEAKRAKVRAELIQLRQRIYTASGPDLDWLLDRILLLEAQLAHL